MPQTPTPVITTVTGEAKNMSSEVLLTQWQNTTGSLIYVTLTVDLSNLNTSLADGINIRVSQTDGSDNLIGGNVSSRAGTKTAAENTTYRVLLLSPIPVANDDKLLIYGISSNASSTSVNASVQINDAHWTKSPPETISEVILGSDEIKSIKSALCGKVIKTETEDGVKFDFYDTDNETILHTYIYSDDNTREVVEEI